MGLNVQPYGLEWNAETTTLFVLDYLLCSIQPSSDYGYKRSARKYDSLWTSMSLEPEKSWI